MDLAYRAKEIYEKRSPEEKRMLLSHIFSNLTLIDQKVIHTLKKPLELLAKRVQEKIDAKIIFEQQNSLSRKGQKGVLYSDSSFLLRRQGSNLRPIDYICPYITKRDGLYHLRDPPCGC